MGSIIQQSPGVPSAHRVEPGSFPLHLANFPQTQPPAKDPGVIAEAWIESFNISIHEKEPSSLFLKESYWRDHLCLSWELRCLQGSENIKAFLKKGGCRIKSLKISSSRNAAQAPTVMTLAEGVNTVQAFIEVETDVGSGSGMIKFHSITSIFSLLIE